MNGINNPSENVQGEFPAENRLGWRGCLNCTETAFEG